MTSVPVVCSVCGTVVAEGGAGGGAEPPLTWTSSVERGRRVWYCDRCSREHLRAIEGRLDSEWF